jgi:hypothetical protein
VKNTDPRGYLYPECNPPLVEDASDIVHLGNLAVGVDRDLEQIGVEAERNIMRTPGGHIARGASQVLAPGDYLSFPITRFLRGCTNVGNGLRVDEAGAYMVTFWINTTSPTGNNNMAGIVTLDGVGDRLLEGLGSYDGGSFSPGNNASGSALFRFPAGRVIRLRPTFGNLFTGNITVNFAEFACVRVGEM